MKKAIKAVVEGRSLSLEESKRVMNLMLDGGATQAQLGRF